MVLWDDEGIGDEFLKIIWIKFWEIERIDIISKIKNWFESI